MDAKSISLRSGKTIQGNPKSVQELNMVPDEIAIDIPEEEEETSGDYYTTSYSSKACQHKFCAHSRGNHKSCLDSISIGGQEEQAVKRV